MEANITTFSNTEKFFEYNDMMVRFKKAQRQGFAFELLWIVYSMLEDRASAFLYHIGFVNDDRQNIINETVVRNFIRDLINPRKIKSFGLDKLINKTEAIRLAVKWLDTVPAVGKYQKELKVLLKRGCIIDISFLDCLDNIDDWRIKRNKLTHELFLGHGYKYDELLSLADEGYKLARTLDNAANALRKRNNRVNIRTMFS